MVALYDLLHFNAVAAAKYPEDGSDEDNTFAKPSPAATVKLPVANLAVIGLFFFAASVAADWFSWPVFALLGLLD